MDITKHKRFQNQCMREHMGTETVLVNVVTGKQKIAPAFQPRGHRPEHLLCHVFEGRWTDKEAHYYYYKHAHCHE